MEPKWIPVHPPFADDQPSLSLFIHVAGELEDLVTAYGLVSMSAIRECRDQAQRDARRHLKSRYQAVCLAVSILCDLVSQGWGVQVANQKVQICKPVPGTNRAEEKERVRRALLLARDEQLSEPSVQTFVRSMEARRLGPQGWHSIFSLMRDGDELAAKLETAAAQPTPDLRAQSLESATQPYLQFVTEDAVCERTGLRLADIWRYFRYTWLTPARSVPGRSMAILVRDAAIEPHPVIGIAALASSIVQQSERDREIGWDKDTILAEIKAEPTDELASWLLCSLDQIINNTYMGDLVTPDQIEQPTHELIEQLQAISLTEKDKHQIHARNLNYKQQQDGDRWESLTATHLYRGKRAKMLATLLFIRRSFREAGLIDGSAVHLATAASNVDFRTAVSRLVRFMKAVHVGINMMDISVAGAIAPYNAILGGKLVSLLLASPEVRAEYNRRYGQSASIIASGMKGQPVVRTPELVLLCTTGLFTGGSSQYNRICLPADQVSTGHGEIRYHQLATETEFATFHISQATMDVMKIYSEQSHDGSSVNSIFGEGVNPKMRKITESLKRMGFPPEEVLKAGSPRAIYMIPLAHNYRAVMLGRADQPDYILPSDEPMATTQRIAQFWRDRWLSGRVSQSDVITATRQHRRMYPIVHGAIVQIPDTDGQAEMRFDSILAESAPETSIV